MKKLIITMIILISVFTGKIEAYNQNNNNDLKFIGYSPRIQSELYEDKDGTTLVINYRYNVYELFIPQLGDWSIQCNDKRELMEYYKTYKENKSRPGILKIKHTKKGYDVYFSFLGGKPYKVDKKYLIHLLTTYREYKEV